MVTLKMWIWGAGYTAKQLMKHEIDIFKERFSDIDIDVSLIPWRDAWESIMNAANEQKGPDILQVGSTWNATLADLGVLKDITQEVSDVNLTGDIFVPATWSSCHFPDSDRISSLPWFADIRAIYYRQDILRELGMSADNLDNWKSFEQACENIKSYRESGKEIEVIGVSGQSDALLLHNIAPWIWSAGGDFLSADRKKATFNNQKSLNGIKFFMDLVSNGYITSSALKSDTEQIASGFFQKGDYAMCIPGPLSEHSLRDPSSVEYKPEITGNCTSSLFPTGPAGRFVFCGGSNLAITSFTEHPKEAWEFIRFLTSYESQSRYPKRLNMFPTLLESFDAIFIEEKPEWKGLKDSWRYGRAFPNVAVWGAIESLLIETFGRIFTRIQDGNYDFSLVKDDLDRLAGDVDDLLVR